MRASLVVLGEREHVRNSFMLQITLIEFFDFSLTDDTDIDADPIKSLGNKKGKNEVADFFAVDWISRSYRKKNSVHNFLEGMIVSQFQIGPHEADLSNFYLY
jgi:hypothetical protein